MNCYELYSRFQKQSSKNPNSLLPNFYDQTLIIRNKKISIKNDLVPRALFFFDIGMAENIKTMILVHLRYIKKE